MVFAPFVSPSLLVRRDILGFAATEAVRYGITVKDVIDSFFAGNARPGLTVMLDRAYAMAGLPPHEVMQMVSSFFNAEEIETADVLVVLEAHRDQLPNSVQAKELVEAIQRLARRARTHEKFIKAAQAAHDARMVEMEPPPADPPRPPLHRPVKARAVQRYSGLKARR
jgi:hypothetical protein